jgi:hypothetical protein
MESTMLIRSLGINSDLMLHSRNAEIVDRGEYVLVRTSHHPTYFWGNYLIFAYPPGADQAAGWEAAFDFEFAGQPLSTHRSFTWDTVGMQEPATPDAISAFERRGYEYDVSVVLAATAVIEPPYPNDGFEYRPLVSARDWEQMLALQVECRDEEFAEDPYREFMRGRVSAWRKLIDSGTGVWLGAFDGDLLVADAGLFWQGGMGRFQNVETRSGYRRQGICGSLVYRLSRYGLGTASIAQLIMQADEDYHAARIYESLGFVRKERMGGLCIYDRPKWGA